MSNVVWIVPKSQSCHPTPPTGPVMHVITYGQGRFRQFYLDVPVESARKRFEANMRTRTQFEILDEGWDAILETIRFDTAGEAWRGRVGDQFQRMCEYYRQLAELINTEASA